MVNIKKMGRKKNVTYQGVPCTIWSYRFDHYRNGKRVEVWQWQDRLDIKACQGDGRTKGFVEYEQITIAGDALTEDGIRQCAERLARRHFGQGGDHRAVTD